MATTRLRQTFRYPTESDSDEPEGIDEQEQETLISTLQTTDQKTSHLYTQLLLLLPLTPILVYLPSLFRGSSALTSLLSITSLLSTAYILYYIPLAPSKFTPTSSLKRNLKPRAHLDIESEDEGPVRKYIVYLNAALCGVLALREVASGRDWREGMEGGGLVPGFVYALILVARMQLRPVDVGELERLRYPYKGA